MSGLAFFLGGAAGGALAGGWLGAYLIRRRFETPLAELERGITKWAQGDLSASLERENLGAWQSLAAIFDKARDEQFRLVGERRREVSRDRMRLESRLESLIRNIPDGLVLCDLRGDVVAINPAAVEILCFKGEKGADGVNTPEFRMKIQEILKNHTRTDLLELPQPRTGGLTSGSYRTVVRLFSNPGADDISVMLLLREITSERRLDEMKDEFFQSVAHDLRSPLFAMQGYLRLLEKSINPDKHQKGYFDAIAQSCEKLTLFIQDTLDSARIEAGQLPLTIMPIDPAALARRAIELFQPLAAEKGIRLELSALAGVPSSIDVDERLMERVFFNLLSNALKFTPRGGAVSVGVSAAGPREAEFSVTDTGPGIAEAQRSQIFEKFRQAETGQPRLGFGLGLNICRKIVRLHQGTIWAESEPGKGSQFIFRIPVKHHPLGEKHAAAKDS